MNQNVMITMWRGNLMVDGRLVHNSIAPDGPSIIRDRALKADGALVLSWVKLGSDNGTLQGRDLNAPVYTGAGVRFASGIGQLTIFHTTAPGAIAPGTVIGEEGVYNGGASPDRLYARAVLPSPLTVTAGCSVKVVHQLTWAVRA